MLAVTVMPGPQMVAAIPVCRWFKETYPGVPIVWGGYFPSHLSGHRAECELRRFRGARAGRRDVCRIAGRARRRSEIRRDSRAFVSRRSFGLHVHNPERPMRSPGDFPVMPYHRLDPAKYLLPTFLGSRTAVHQASIGCPYKCNFCGVVDFSGSREKMEPPEHTARVLGPAAARLWRERGPVLRQQFLPARGSRPRIGRSPDAAWT